MKIFITAASTDTSDRIKIARTTNDPKLLSRLSYDPNRTIRDIVSKNKNLPEYAMQQLAKDPSVDIRIRVAGRTNDSKVFSILSTDIDDRVRKLVADRCNDQSILEEMIFDDSSEVREIVVQKIQDPEILALALEDSSDDVRYALASTCKNPEILSELSKDSNKDVSAIASKRLANLRNVSLHPANRYRDKFSETTQTDWSVSPFEISSYSEIESEIDEVIDLAVDQYATEKGGDASIQIDGYGYDSATTIKILFRDRSGKLTTYTADIDEILAPATSNNRKSVCIQNVIRWLKRTFK